MRSGRCMQPSSSTCSDACERCRSASSHVVPAPAAPAYQLSRRYNNTKQFELQVRSKMPLPRSKLKQGGGATSRPTAGAGADAARARATSVAARTASVAPTPLAAPPAPAQQQQQAHGQVPDTPDSRGKALRAAAEAGARAALRETTHQWHQQSQQLLSGCVGSSPEDHLQQALPPGEHQAAGLDAIPDTGARPRLPLPPAELAAGLGQSLARVPSTRLDFGAASRLVVARLGCAVCMAPGLCCCTRRQCGPCLSLPTSHPAAPLQARCREPSFPSGCLLRAAAPPPRPPAPLATAPHGWLQPLAWPAAVARAVACQQ